jgi:hypothetical protein
VYLQGNGTKNIVLLGNSHARALHAGVAYHFRHIYKSLTMFQREYCMPFYSDHAHENAARDPLYKRSPYWL